MLAWVLPLSAFAQTEQVSVVGSETLVNTTTAETQEYAKIAANSNEDYIMVWSSLNEDGDDFGVYVKGISGDGSTFLSEQLVNNSTTGTQTHADVDMSDAGVYIITWMSNDGENSDTDGFAIYRTIRTTAGVTYSNNGLVNTTYTGQQKFPAAAISELGKSVIVWEDEGVIKMQRYDASYAATGGEITLDSASSPGYQTLPDVAMDSVGNLVVVWQSTGKDGDGAGVYAVRFDSSGTQEESVFRVSTTTSGDQVEPRVAMDDQGNFVITWADSERDNNGYGVYAQMYNSDGSTNGNNFRVNSTTGQDQRHPEIDMSVGGNFAITWTSWNNDDEESAVMLQVYNAEGESKDDEIQVNTYEGDYQMMSAVALPIYVESPMYVVWQSGANAADTTQDGDDYGIYFQEYLVDDLENPVVVLQDITVELDNVGDYTLTVNDIENGSTDNIGIVTYAFNSSGTKSVTYLDCGDIGDNNITLYVIDSAGNVGSAKAVVHVADVTYPTVGGKDLTLYLDASGATETLTVSKLSNGTSTDNCGVTLGNISQTDFDCTEVGENTITWTGTDPYGNVTYDTLIMTVVDTISPDLTAVDVTVYLDGDGNASVYATDLYTGASDNCSISSVVAADTAFTCDDVGTAVQVDVRAYDASGNSTTVTAYVTVMDSTAPTAVAQDITAYLDGSGSATITADDIDNGSSDNCTFSTSIDVSSFTCSELGSNTVILTVTDASGLTDTDTVTVTVVDTTAPSVVTADITVYLDGSGSATITSGDVDGGSTDNCSISTYQVNNAGFTCSDVGANTVTLSVTDGSGNVGTGTATVTVLDTVTPSVSTVDVTVYLDANGSATITTGDVDNGSSDNCSIASYALDNTDFSCSDIGANTVTLSVTDGSGNVGTADATITVLDSTAPTVVLQDLTVYLDGSGSTSVSGSAYDNGSSDNCSTVTFEADQVSFSCADLGSNTIGITVADGSGNMVTTSATLTVFDTTSPSLVSQDITVYLGADGTVSVTGADVDNGSSDNCSIDSYTLSQSSFSCSDLGTNAVTFTVADASGNSTSGLVNITVLDTTAPTVVTQNVTIYLDESGSATLTVADVDNGSSDNCSIATYELSQTTFDCNSFSEVVTLTITDGSGNVATGTATVYLDDTLAPVLDPVTPYTAYLDASGSVTVVASDLAGNTTDNCNGEISYELWQDVFTCSDLGSVSVAMQAWDIYENASETTVTIIVSDTIAPTALAQDITLTLDATGTITITGDDIDNGSSDNCSVSTLELDQYTFTSADLGANTVTLTVTDGSGNSSTATATVTVQKDDQTITFDALSDVTYGDHDFDLTATASSGLTVTYTSSNTAVATISGSTLMIVGAGTTDITASQAGDDNFNAATDVVQSLTVNQSAQTITFDALSNVTYGDADFNLTATASSGLTVTYTSSDPTVATVSGSTVTIVGVGSTAITASQAGDDNYLAAVDVAQTLTVDVSAITITADDQSKYVGESDPTLTYQITNGSLASGDVVSGDLTRDAGEDAGTYAITQGTLSVSSNYSLTFVAGTLTISDLIPQTITFDAIADMTWGDDDFTLTATGGDSGNPVTFSSSDPSVASVSGSTVTINGVGTVTITASQAGTSSYAAADDVTQTFTVNQQALTVTAITQSKTYGDNDPSLSYSLTSGTLHFNETLTGSLDRISGEDVGSYEINQGTLAAPSSNYDLTFVANTLTISTRAITVTADSTGKYLGEDDPTFTYSVTSGALQFSDAFSGELSRDAGEDEATYAITQGTLDAGSNYDLTFVSADFTITIPVCNEVKPTGLVAEQGTLTGLDSSWVTVYFDETFLEPVVIGTPVLDASTDPPMVVRVRNVSSCGFQMKVQSTGGDEPSNVTVYWLAVEEGTYTEAEHGVAMEARTVTSTLTSYKNNYFLESVGYNQTYTKPIVFGQVMTENNEAWSVFWAAGDYRFNPPTSSALSVSKHVGSSSNTSLASETLGFIVLESGVGTIGDYIEYRAALTNDEVMGAEDVPAGYTYDHTITGATRGLASIAGLDGGDGGWAVLREVTPFDITVSYDEDQEADTERLHTTEQVTYLVLGSLNPNPTLALERGTVSGIDSSWTSVTFTESFVNPVVVATPVLPDTATGPMVTRVRNVTDTGFQVRIQSAGGDEPSNITVHWLAVEEGTYTVAEHGIAMEAQIISASETANTSSWTQETQTLNGSYTSPVVLGQVMTYNDDEWSVFWSSSTNRLNPATSSDVTAGKQVSSDPSTTRNTELIGMIVFESGSGTINGLTYEAGVGSDIVMGVGNTADGYTYSIDVPGADAAVLSIAAMDGGDGGWPVLFGDPLSNTTLKLIYDEDQYGDEERAHTTEQVAYIVFGEDPGLVVEKGTVADASDSWTTVTLTEDFNSPVVVATPVLPNSSTDPVVTRVRNVTATSFEVRVQTPGGTAPSGITVHWVAVEEGTYTVAEHGIAMEAQIVSSTATAGNNDWSVRENRSFNQTYTNPVVLGQVMTYNDTEWSVFWSSNSTRTAPADPTDFQAGKQVAGDPNTTRADETLGMIIIEAGSGSFGGFDFTAGVGDDIVEGSENTSVGYSFSHSLSAADVAVVSGAGMDGGDGGWPVLYGDGVTSSDIKVVIDEETISDAERLHTTEQAAYWILADQTAVKPIAVVEADPLTDALMLTADSFTVYPNPTSGPFALRIEGQDRMPDIAVRLVDMSGRTWELQPEYVGNQAVSFDVSGMPQGMYMLLLDTPSGQFTKKVMVK